MVSLRLVGYNAQLDPAARSMVLVDAATGAEATPVVVDEATGRRVDGDDFVFTAGPAASAPFVERYAHRPRPSGGEKPRRRRLPPEIGPAS